ncbi:ABC1 kinase family protein [Lewinella cohaerens]|uniref:ABC1 kinase family protein n=1 Tax=Lewinella cohaerens TaxID=70995 RepID=UPI00035EE99A|nr:AarF/ABC1/UbiB kinase family protein [Lewinella cohaerens]
MKGGALNITTTSTLMRYEKVFGTFVKYGFEDLLAHPPLNKLVPQANRFVPSRAGRKVSEFTRYERIRLVCEELGTTFIKFAQIASNRPDLLPDELITELAKLQDQVPPVALEEIYATLEQEFSRPWQEMVEYFDPQPLASASMAQVHRARLVGGREVVLKVQRPGIREVVAADITILNQLVGIIESYFPALLVYQPSELVKMFEQSITEELSFRREAANLLHFQQMFRDHSKVLIPAVYRELSTDKVLCMEYVSGYKITDLDQLSQFNITGEELALRGIGLYFEQVFEHGFFHADPHPGNIFVLEDGRIAFLDYGMVGTVSDRDKLLFAQLLLAIYDQDVQGLKKAILKFSTGLSKDKERELEYDIIYVLRQYASIALEDIDGMEVMQGLNALFFDYKIKLPANLLLLLKALVIMEGVGLQLDPNYDIIANIGPYVQRLLSKRYSPLRLRRELMRSAEDTTNLLRELPEDLREILRKVKEGKLHIEFEHKGLQPTADKLSDSIKLLSYTLLVVAVIIASSLIVVAKIPPLVNGFALWGIVGFGIAALLALRTIFSLRKKK